MAEKILSRGLGQAIEFPRGPIEEARRHSEDMAPRLEWIDRVGGIADIEGLQRPFGRITFTFGALVWSLDADFDRMKRVGLVDLYEP